VAHQDHWVAAIRWVAQQQVEGQGQQQDKGRYIHTDILPQKAMPVNKNAVSAQSRDGVRT
jgi:hypothetical protein